MLAWRSFLRRTNPLITSRLQPVRRHDATHAALPCRNLTASSRRHISGHTTINGDSYSEQAPASPTSNRLVSDQDRQLGRTADQQHRRTAAAKQHLYLVLDDHRHEYGIYKLDLDADAYAADDEEVGSDSARPLPHPAVFRLEVPTDTARFHALGSCIVTTGSIPDELGICREHCNRGVTYLYDTATPALSVACDIPEGLSDGYHHAVAVGGRLFAFEMETEGPGGMQCMRTDGRDDDRKSWLACSSRCFWGAHPVEPPFYVGTITALAVHPSGRAFFVSASEGRRGDVRAYSYDTTSGGQWVSCRGGWRWELPFVGHACYDRELDAWVGLHMDEDCLYETDGHLCACRVPLPSTEQRAPQWTVGEKMLLEHPDWRHVDAKLVHMAERGEYCLFERLRREGTNQKECLRDGDECLLHLTRFRLKYPEDGELVMAVDRRRHTRSYRVSRYRDDFEVGAFWI